MTPERVRELVEEYANAAEEHGRDQSEQSFKMAMAARERLLDAIGQLRSEEVRGEGDSEAQG